jgi:glucoamylase
VAAKDFESARWELHAMEVGALPSGLIPEQTLSPSTNAAPSAAANGVACPLVWAHAEDILLHRSIEDESIFDTP